MAESKVACEPVALRVAVGFKSRRVASERRVGALMRAPFANKRNTTKLRRWPRICAAPHDEMPQFKISDDRIDMIVAYNNSLSTRK